jgi:hypothetical protein
MPLTVIGCVAAGSGIALWQIVATKGDKPITPVLQIPIWIAYWLYCHYHVLVSLMGYSYSEISFYAEEAAGALSDNRVKAHLRRHVALIDMSEASQRLGADQAAAAPADDEAAERAALGLTAEDRVRVLANLNFFQARRRAVTETVIAEAFEMGDNITFSGQNGLKSERDLGSVGSSATLGSAGTNATFGQSGSVKFERKLLAAVQAESGGAGFNMRSDLGSRSGSS